MFRRLRNHLVAFNLCVSTVIIVISFTAIYMVVSNATAERARLASTTELYPSSFLQTLDERMRLEREASLRSLLTTLVVTGILMEAAVAIFSYVWTQEAIRPVKQAYDSQRTFIANASHEIKTPLAAIEANLEAADIQDNRWIDNVRTETRALAALNQDLLTLTRVDSVPAPQPETFALRPTVEQVVAPFAPRLQHKILRQDLPDLEITAAKADFTQLLTILLDNAIKYSHRRIWLRYADQTLSVENDGTTIPAADLPHLFERFYQRDKSREGVGLGLAIAQSLAERNHWQLSVTSDRTTIFRLKF